MLVLQVLLELLDLQPVSREERVMLVLERSLSYLQVFIKISIHIKVLVRLHFFLVLRNRSLKNQSLLQYFMLSLAFHLPQSITLSEFLELERLQLTTSLQPPRKHSNRLFVFPQHSVILVIPHQHLIKQDPPLIATILEYFVFMVRLYILTLSLFRPQKQQDQLRFLVLHQKSIQRHTKLQDLSLDSLVHSNLTQENHTLELVRSIFLRFLVLQSTTLIKYQDLTLSSFDLYHK